VQRLYVPILNNDEEQTNYAHLVRTKDKRKIRREQKDKRKKSKRRTNDEDNDS